jgi:MraZ protein
MLLGTYEHAIDEKNRLTLPARFREAFVDGVFLTRGMDGCVVVYTKSAWDQLVSVRLADLDPFSRGRLRRRTGSTGTRCRSAGAHESRTT